MFAQWTIQSPIQEIKITLLTGKWMELEIIVQDKPVSESQVWWSLIIVSLNGLRTHCRKTPLAVGEGISRRFDWGWKTNLNVGSAILGTRVLGWMNRRRLAKQHIHYHPPCCFPAASPHPTPSPHPHCRCHVTSCLTYRCLPFLTVMGCVLSHCNSSVRLLLAWSLITATRKAATQQASCIFYHM